jgi:hypothetical protein
LFWYSKVNVQDRFMGEMRNAYKILVGKPEEMRALGRPRHRWGILECLLAK